MVDPAYRHTQAGILTRGVLGSMAVAVIALQAAVGLNGILLFILGVLALAFVAFGSLTVQVTTTEVSVRFGPGWIRKRFPTSAIETVSVVTNPWYYGWGLRWFVRGWLYNVSGFDAVELEMRDGRIYRIGTDEPNRLETAIREVIS